MEMPVPSAEAWIQPSRGYELVRAQRRPPAEAVMGPNLLLVVPTIPIVDEVTTSSKNTPHPPWQDAVPSPTRATKILLGCQIWNLGVTVQEGVGVDVPVVEAVAVALAEDVEVAV